MNARDALQLAKTLPTREFENALSLCIDSIKDSAKSGGTNAIINVDSRQLKNCGDALVQMGYSVKEETNTTLSVDWSNA